MILIVIGMFTALFGLMPSDFFENQADYNPLAGQSQEVVDYYSRNNITLYTYSWAFNLTVNGDMAYNQSGLPDGHQIEVHFLAPPQYSAGFVHIRHAFPSWFFGLWLEYHPLFMVEPFATLAGYNKDLDLGFGGIGGTHYIGPVLKAHLEALANGNSSYFEAACEHITINFVFFPYNSSYADIGDSWEAGFLHVLSSYEIDFDAMKPSAWLLIAQLLTFQNPDFGIPGDLGTVLNYGMGLGFWIIIAIAMYTIITRVIPTIQGGIED